ncbi:MAG: exosortase/archaeosortase family protein [Candidatus Altarchaeaceae archaeon]
MTQCENKYSWNLLILVAVLLGLLSIIYFYTILWLVTSWYTDPYYMHGVLIPFISGFFIWKKRKQLVLNKQANILPGVLILAFSIILYFLGYFFAANFISGISLVICIIGIAFIIYGESARKILFPLCFLIFMVPFPFLEMIGKNLQFVSAQISALILKIFYAQTEISGAIILIGEHSFMVAPSCSGISSIISLLAIVTLLTYFIKCEIYKKIFLIAIVIPVALFTNSLRIVMTVFGVKYYGEVVISPLFHGLFNVVFFIISIILVFLCIKFLRCKIKKE